MEQLEPITAIIAMTMGVAWASGINLYATLLVLGVLGSSGHLVLPDELQIVTDPLVIAAAGFMYFVEFFADKIPGVDSGWDGLHTFIRIPAGAALAAGAVGDMNAAVVLAAAIVGGSLTATTHATKAGARVLINTSPEPFSNWTASVTEDIAAITGLWLALYNPWLFLILLVLFIVVMIWILPKLWSAIKKLFNAVRQMFRRRTFGKIILPDTLSAGANQRQEKLPKTQPSDSSD